ADLDVAVRNILRVLRPDGLLFLLEGVAPERWVDLTFGLTEGWWRFNDHQLRPRYPLIGREQWLDLLGRRGFREATAVPGPPIVGRGATQQALLVARAPARRRSWALIGADEGLRSALARLLEDRGESALSLAVGASTSALDQCENV